MATKEFLEKRIAGKEKEIAGLQKKLARIKAAESSNWEKNPYMYSEYDLRSVLKEIEYAEKMLAEYHDKLAQEEEKSASRNVQVILDFLAGWKQRVLDYYQSIIASYFADRNAILALRKIVDAFDDYTADADSKHIHEANKAYLEELRWKFQINRFGEFEDIPEDSPKWRKWSANREKVRTGKYECIKEYFNCSTESEALDKLTALLDKEASAKYDAMIEKTNKIVGQITDASQLCIGLKGDLNGVIIGTKGIADVHTIGAGGYNIQCYHFRTLIREGK